MTQSEQLALVRNALDRAAGSLSLAHGGVIDVARLNVDTCEAVLSWLAYVVTQEEERLDYRKRRVAGHVPPQGY